VFVTTVALHFRASLSQLSVDRRPSRQLADRPLVSGIGFTQLRDQGSGR